MTPTQFDAITRRLEAIIQREDAIIQRIDANRSTLKMRDLKLDAIETAINALADTVASLIPATTPALSPKPSSELPEAPEGFHPAVMGPLKVEANERQCNDVATQYSGEWEIGYFGDSNRIYSLRKGSKIAKFNNLE